MGAAGPSKRKRKRAGAQQSRRTKPRLENGEAKVCSAVWPAMRRLTLVKSQQDDEDDCGGESDTTEDEEKLLGEKKAAELLCLLQDTQGGVESVSLVITIGIGCFFTHVDPQVLS